MPPSGMTRTCPDEPPAAPRPRYRLRRFAETLRATTAMTTGKAVPESPMPIRMPAEKVNSDGVVTWDAR